MRARMLAGVERALALVGPYRAAPPTPPPAPQGLEPKRPASDVPCARGALRRELHP